MNTKLVIHNARIITPYIIHNPGWLLCEGGTIRIIDDDHPPPIHLDNAIVIDAKHRTLLPGFIDLHVHGGMNCEAMDATPESLHTMARFYAQHGVTAFLATTWTDSRERIQAALENIATCMGSYPDGATLLGAHLEGPYINDAKGGAQNPEHIRRAHRDEAKSFLDIDVIRLLALAPEYRENHWLIEACIQRGITVSIAHTAATYEEVRHAVALGATQATHTFNAMSGLHHREPGAVGAVLTNDIIRAEIIADNVHVHPAVLNLIHRTKREDGIILVSDAVRCAGMPDGDYPIDDRTISVHDGIARLPDGTLAGSTLTMDRALYNFMRATSSGVASVWRTSSLNPARAIGLHHQKGSIEIDKDADLVLVDADMSVYATIAEGRIIYQREDEHVSH